MKGYEHRSKDETAFALNQTGRIPEAIAGISLGKPAHSLFALPIFIWSILIASILPVEANQTEWLVSQKQSEMGAYTVYLTKDAIKIVNQALGYEVVAKAPTWKVIVYRPKEKLGTELALKDFAEMNIFSLMLEHKRPGKRNLIKLETTETNGLKICKYETYDHNEHTWTTEAFGAPPEAILIAEASYRLKSAPGFPLRVVYYGSADMQKIPTSSWMSGGINMAHGRLENLKTDSWKTVPYRASDFVYPTNFQHTKDPHELVFSRSKKSTMEDIARDMGIGEELGGSKK